MDRCEATIQHPLRGALLPGSRSRGACSAFTLDLRACASLAILHDASGVARGASDEAERPTTHPIFKTREGSGRKSKAPLSTFDLTPSTVGAIQRAEGRGHKWPARSPGHCPPCDS